MRLKAPVLIVTLALLAAPLPAAAQPPRSTWSAIAFPSINSTPRWSHNSRRNFGGH